MDQRNKIVIWLSTTSIMIWDKTLSDTQVESSGVHRFLIPISRRKIPNIPTLLEPIFNFLLLENEAL